VAWRRLFQDWDVVIAPQVLVPAPPHSTVPTEERFVEINGQRVPARAMTYFSAVPILTGLPATNVPLGLSKGGLPIGIQAIGPYLEDRTAIRFADLVTREVGGYQRPPGYDEE
jgi:amidase